MATRPAHFAVSRVQLGGSVTGGVRALGFVDTTATVDEDVWVRDGRLVR